MAAPSGETFAPASGRVTGALGLVVVAALVVIDLVQPNSIPLPVVAGALVLGVLMWATMLRPQVSVRIAADAGTLVLRNAVTTVLVPLAAIEDLSVRQVLAVRTARRRYVGAGVGRSVRQALHSGPTNTKQQAMRPTLGPSFGGDMPSQVEPGMVYADWVELRLRDLAQEDRDRRRIRAYSEQADALADQVVRRWALPELVALGLAVAFFVVAMIVALA